MCNNGKIFSSTEVPVSKIQKTFYAKEEITIQSFNYGTISKVARELGAPKDKLAGIYLHVKQGEPTKKGEPIFTLFSSSKQSIQDAEKVLKTEKLFVSGKSILGVIHKIENF